MLYLVENKHWDLVQDYNFDKILYLLIDRPSLVDNNFLLWKKYKIGWHRNYDLPAGVYSDQTIIWYKNNKHHREDNKPAYINNKNHKEWYINDNFIKSENYDLYSKT